MSRRRRRQRSKGAGLGRSAWRSKVTLTQVFLLCALVIGGAGTISPLANLVIVLLGTAVLVQRLGHLQWRALDTSARIAAGLILAMAALCLAQVVPLPRGVWSALPGHALAAQLAAAVGGAGWTAWSLSPDRTLDSLASLIPAAAGLVIAVQATPEERRSILRLLLAFALVSAALAIVQLAAGPGSAPVLFGTRHRGFGIGFFVNRNHLALFLLLAMLIAALPGIPLFTRKVENPRAVEWALRSGALALLALGVLATLSRTGFFLMPFALAAALVMSQRSRVKVPVLLGGLAAAGLLAFALRAAPPVQMLLERFATAAEDKRFEYWANTVVAMRDALPLGTGFGTFTLIYPNFEPLVEVRPDVVNHAHNDLLELVLEAGVPGVALLLAWLALVVFAVLRARRGATTRRERLLPLVVATGVALTLAASLVDYPVRMYTISVTLGLLLGMLLSRRTEASHAVGGHAVGGQALEDLDPVPPPPPPRRRRSWLAALPLGMVALYTLSSQGGQQLVAWGNASLAGRLAPWSSRVQSAAATQYQVRADVPRSSQAARRALALSPLDAAAVRAEGMAALAGERRERGAALMSLAARLGWRDGLTQLWLAEQAIAAGAYGFAVERIDAVLRQEKFSDELLPFLPGMMRTEEGRAGLAGRLRFNPGWRFAFFNAVARDRTWTMPQLLDVVARLRRAGVPMQPAESALIRAVLADQGRYADVRGVWRASGQRTLVGDGRFEDTSGQLPIWAAPYAWSAPPLAGVRLQATEPDIARAGKGGGKALAISSGGVAQGTALAQTLALAPGRYAVAFTATSRDAAIARGLRLALRCRDDVDDPRLAAIAVPIAWSGAQGEWQQARGTITVPGDCPGQSLMLSIPQADGRPYTIWLDDVSIGGAADPRA